jgi:hypothetical protein
LRLCRNPRVAKREEIVDQIASRPTWRWNLEQ